MDLGYHVYCINAKDLATSKAFYQKLGFDYIEKYSSEKRAVMRHNDIHIALFQGVIPQNCLNFRGGDIQEIVKEAKGNGLKFDQEAEELPDKTWHARIFDPDGNEIFLHTDHHERETSLKEHGE